MAYTRRRRYRRNMRKKSTPSWAKQITPSNAVKAASLAQAAYRGVMMLKGLVNSERMYSDRTCTLGAARSNVWGLTLLSQGDGPNNRTGNSILLRSIYLRGYCQINPSVVGNTRITLMVVRDNQQIADTTPTVTDILKTDDPDSMLNSNTAGRYKIVWRKQIVLYPQSSGAGSVRDITKYLKVYDHVRYNGATGTDIQKHGYYLVMTCSEITNFPTIDIESRIGYHDN